MAISRRQLLRRAGAFGTSALLVHPLSGCGDDGGDATTDTVSTAGTEDSTDGTGGGASGTDTATTTDTTTDATTDTTTGGDDGLPRYEYEGEPGPADLFQHGVASGDPLSDGVVLWTRATDASATGDIEGFFEVSESPDFGFRVLAGPALVVAARDYTIKLDVRGLEPGKTYYYRFFALGRQSPVGRTRTAPAEGYARLRFAVCSCSSYAHGYFHNYKHIAARADLDAVLHLGDYIYEYGTGEYGDVRAYEPATEIVSLEDYRTRYSQYRRDADLAELHRQHPTIVVWDDHEITNDAHESGAENHQPDTEGDYATRKAIAYQVYEEWMPIRAQAPGVIYRAFKYGDLVDLLMLDTRIVGRDEQAAGTVDQATIDDPARSILGAEQEQWLEDRLVESVADWRLLGQQVMFAQLINFTGTGIFNVDQWDGYAPNRQRVLDVIADNGLANVVVLTGDIHSSWAFEVAPDPLDPLAYDPATGAGALAVEFVAPGISSPGFPGSLANATPAFLQQNPHLKWADLVTRGYIVLDVTREQVQADWYFAADVEDPGNDAVAFASGWVVQSGTPKLTEATAPASDKPDAPALAPSA